MEWEYEDGVDWSTGCLLCLEGESIRKKDVLKWKGWGSEGEKDNWTNLYVLFDADGWGADYARKGACLVWHLTNRIFQVIFVYELYFSHF